MLTELLIFLTSFLIRLPLLGRDLFNQDSFLWKTRSYQFLGGISTLDFAKTAPVAHPGVILMWVGSVATKLFNIYYKLFKGGIPVDGAETVMLLHSAHKTLLVFVVAILLAVAFCFLKTLTKNKWLAFFVVLLLSLEPFFFALSRTFHLDTLLTLFMFLAVLSWSNFLEKHTDKTKHLRWLLLTSLFTALALLTKSTGLFLLPFLCLISGFHLFYHKQRYRLIIKNYLSLLVFSFLLFTFLWPAMWVEPIQTSVLYFSGIAGEGFGGHTQVIFGASTDNPGLLFYFLSLAIRLSPWTLLLFLGGVTKVVINILTKKKDKNTILNQTAILFITLYLILLIIPTKKIERYLLPLYPWLVVLGGCFLYSIVDYISNVLKKCDLTNKNVVKIVATAAILVVVGISLTPIHPNYLAYYSPLFGGLSKGPYIIEPTWAIGTTEVAEFMNSLPNAGEFKYSIPNWDQYQPFSRSKVYGVAEFFEGRSDYLVMPVWANLEDYYEYAETKSFTLENIKTIKINRVPVYNVFEIRTRTKDSE